MAANMRIHSIDIMRGLTLFLMLFVNDLYIAGVPKWLVHASENEDGMGLADWVFPGFLFIVGLSIPFAFKAREKLRQSGGQILLHILIRTVSLLIIGVFIVNLETYNAELTGINKYLWAILVYLSVFLVWNRYPKNSRFEGLFRILRYSGILGLCLLAAIYRSGTADAIDWMSTSWWGILGLIGWGYLVSALTYLWLRDRVLATVFVWVGFILLNVLAKTPYMNFLDSIKPIFGVVLNGNIPSIVLAGLVIGIVLKKNIADSKRFLTISACIALVCLGLAFVLHKWFIISKLSGTPSWSMLCNGISILVFIILFYLCDIMKWRKPWRPFLPAGKNSLTTYLAPDIVYYIIWGLGSNVLFYKQADMPWLAVLGSIVWALAMIGFAALLSRINIRLKL